MIRTQAIFIACLNLLPPPPFPKIISIKCERTTFTTLSDYLISKTSCNSLYIVSCYIKPLCKSVSFMVNNDQFLSIFLSLEFSLQRILAYISEYVKKKNTSQGPTNLKKYNDIQELCQLKRFL